MNAEQISQWVIENRFKNSEINDFEFFQNLKDKIKIYAEQCCNASLEKASIEAKVKQHFLGQNITEFSKSIGNAAVIYSVCKKSITVPENIVLL